MSRRLGPFFYPRGEERSSLGRKLAAEKTALILDQKPETLIKSVDKSASAMSAETREISRPTQVRTIIIGY
ncbi:MAG TPA: hypothetical protein VJ974_06575 [Geopsychrobacteraceae bacterium]|nr:hypothetical protein [Geopsychrobacteraceae bacterium]